MPDPTLGIVRSNLLIPAGWHGQAHVDRSSDPLGNGIAVVTADLTSPDGQSHIVMLPMRFWTYGASRGVAAHMPGNPLAQRNAALAPFRSSADLLTRTIVPALGLAGELGPVSSGRTYTPQALKQVQDAMRAHGTPGPVFDWAEVTVRKGKSETAVYVLTSGANAGTPRESTYTEITLVSAPAGRAEAILKAFNNLPKQEATPAWLQADMQYFRMRQDKQAREQKAISDRIQADTRSIVAMGQANVAATQRQGAQRHAAWLEQQQRNTDSGALFRGYLSNSDTSFKWCSASRIEYTVNSAVSPGPEFRRCD